MNIKTVAACALAVVSTLAAAQVKVGVSIPQTGPAAMLGLGQKRALELYAPRIQDTPVQYMVLDDASDTTAAVTNVRRLTTEQNVDVIVGSSTSPQCLAMIEPAAEAETPLICLGSATAVVAPMDAKRKWVFKLLPNDALWIEGMVAHMVASGVKSVGFIGFSDAFGQGWLNAFNEIAARHKLAVVAVERYSRTDTSVTAQAVKIVARQPDAVLVAASGSPGALPVIALRERGYKGAIYLNVSMATKEFFQLAASAANGALLNVGIGLVAEQVPDSHPLKQINLDFRQQYEARFGPGPTNPFAMQGYDAFRVLERAIPLALEKAKPGTKAFRYALRDALEGIKDLPGSTGIYNFTPTDHSGLDLRGIVMVKVDQGRLVYVRP